MATIGNLGSTIKFQVSSKKILNFEGFKQDISGRWADHGIIGKKSKREFLGPDNRKISFDITLSALHGVKPRSTLKKIEKAVEKGTANKLVINGKAVGSNKWVIVSASEAWETMYTKGELVQAKVSLSLEEYL